MCVSNLINNKASVNEYFNTFSENKGTYSMFYLSGQPF